MGILFSSLLSFGLGGLLGWFTTRLGWRIAGTAGFAVLYFLDTFRHLSDLCEQYGRPVCYELFPSDVSLVIGTAMTLGIFVAGIVVGGIKKKRSQVVSSAGPI